MIGIVFEGLTFFDRRKLGRCQMISLSIMVFRERRLPIPLIQVKSIFCEPLITFTRGHYGS